VRAIVVDTNVWAISAGIATHATRRCIDDCTALLLELHEERRRLVVDDAGRIFAEYTGALTRANATGLATKLAKRLLRTQRSSCDRVEITPREDPPGSYDEVPEALRNFDTDDQKFLAVASAPDANRPMIFAGLDGEWWDRRVDLRAAGMEVHFPCVADLMAAEDEDRE
jgi:hypothetical protein